MWHQTDLATVELAAATEHLEADEPTFVGIADAVMPAMLTMLTFTMVGMNAFLSFCSAIQHVIPLYMISTRAILCPV